MFLSGSWRTKVVDYEKAIQRDDVVMNLGRTYMTIKTEPACSYTTNPPIIINFEELH